MSDDDDLQGFKDDLDSIRSGSSEIASAARESDRYTSSSQPRDRESGLAELGRLHDQSESSLPRWAEYGIYAALIIAIIQIYVGIPVPDATLLYVFALGFLVLGLWAGVQKHEELRAAWDRVQEWRGE